MQAKTRSLLFKIHSYLGVALALHFVLLCITGSILIFKEELKDLFSLSKTRATTSKILSPELNTNSNQSRSRAYSKIYEKLRYTYPNHRPLAFFKVDNQPDHIQFRLSKDPKGRFSGAIRETYSLSTLNTVEARPSKASNDFFDWLLHLHKDLFLGSFGEYYMGFVGLLLLVLFIGGAFIYKPYMGRFNSGHLRLSSLKHLLSDFHKFAGLTSFGFCLLIAGTGIILSLSDPIIKYYQFSQLDELRQAEKKNIAISYDTQSFTKVIDEILNKNNSYNIDAFIFPKTQFSTESHYLALINPKEGIESRITELSIVDATTGQQIEKRILPGYLQALLLSEPLHFGNYGGLTLKVIWLFLTLIALFLPISGFILFFKKHKLSTQRKRQKTGREESFNLPGRIRWISAFALTTLAGATTIYFFDGFIQMVGFALFILSFIYFLLRTIGINIRKGQGI